MELALGAREAHVVGDAGLRRAAVALVLRDGASGIELLVIRRAQDPEDPWSGHVGFPGGRVEEGDAEFRETAIRETREEVGLDLGRASYLGALDQIRAVARTRPVDLCIAPFVFRLGDHQEVIAAAKEVASAHWLSLDALLDPAALGTVEYPYGEAILHFPCLRVDGLVVWGLTFRMFTDLAERLQELTAAKPVSMSAP